MLLPSNIRHPEDFKLSPIKVMELAAAKIPGVISLAQGIPGFETPRVIKDFVIEKINTSSCDKYSLTTGLKELRDQIATSLADEDLIYDPDTEIIVSVGAIEAITATLLGTTSPGDEVIIPSPTYTSYQNAIKLAGCVPRFAELDEEHNFDFHIENIERAITKRTRAIFYCNPNNPTGTTFSEGASRELLTLAEKHDLMIITDEVYRDFYFVPEAHFTPALIPEARARVVRIFSFSKAFAMTGWRIGFLHSDKEVVKRILPYHDSMVTCAPVVSQYAALGALKFAGEIIPYFREEYRKRRDICLGFLDQMSDALDYQVPKAGYFVFPRIKDTIPLARDSQKLALDILEKAKLALVPGVAFGPSGESHLRISFGRDTADVISGMERLSQYFSRGSTAKVSVSRGITPTQKSTSLLGIKPYAKRLGRLLLRNLAHLYVERKKPLIIGVVGLRGKTVYKRALTEILSHSKKSVRSSILSYNTEVGMPLSILNLKTPVTLGEKFFFPFKLIEHAFLKSSAPDILVLEYGVKTLDDAKALLSIAKPNWLICSELSLSDTVLPAGEMVEGVKHIVDSLNRSHVLWVDDPSVRALSLPMLEDLKLSSKDVTSSTLTSGEKVYKVTRESPGHSYQLSTLAAVRLAEKLAIPSAAIEGFLNP